MQAVYVIRRILRRAVRYGYTFLGQKQAFMYKLLPVLIDNMGEAYPELVAQKTLIEKVIKEEEEINSSALWKLVSVYWIRQWKIPKPMEKLKSAVKMPLLYMIHSVSRST